MRIKIYSKGKKRKDILDELHGSALTGYYNKKIGKYQKLKNRIKDIGKDKNANAV